MPGPFFIVWVFVWFLLKTGRLFARPGGIDPRKMGLFGRFWGNGAPWAPYSTPIISTK